MSVCVLECATSVTSSMAPIKAEQSRVRADDELPEEQEVATAVRRESTCSATRVAWAEERCECRRRSAVNSYGGSVQGASEGGGEGGAQEGRRDRGTGVSWRSNLRASEAHEAFPYNF